MDVSQLAMWNAAFQHITCDHTLTVTCVQRLQCETETYSQVGLYNGYSVRQKHSQVGLYNGYSVRQKHSQVGLTNSY